MSTVTDMLAAQPGGFTDMVLSRMIEQLGLAAHGAADPVICAELAAYGRAARAMRDAANSRRGNPHGGPGRPAGWYRWLDDELGELWSHGLDAASAASGKSIGTLQVYLNRHRSGWGEKVFRDGREVSFMLRRASPTETERLNAALAKAPDSIPMLDPEKAKADRLRGGARQKSVNRTAKQKLADSKRLA